MIITHADLSRLPGIRRSPMVAIWSSVTRGRSTSVIRTFKQLASSKYR